MRSAGTPCKDPQPNTASQSKGKGRFFRGSATAVRKAHGGAAEGSRGKPAKAEHTAEPTYMSGSIFGMSSTVNLAECCEISTGMVSIDI